MDFPAAVLQGARDDAAFGVALIKIGEVGPRRVDRSFDRGPAGREGEGGGGGKVEQDEAGFGPADARAKFGAIQSKVSPASVVLTLTNNGLSAVGWSAKVRMPMLSRSVELMFSTLVVFALRLMTALVLGGMGEEIGSPFGSRSTTVFWHVASSVEFDRKVWNASAKSITETGPTLVSGWLVTSSIRGEAS